MQVSANLFRAINRIAFPTSTTDTANKGRRCGARKAKHLYVVFRCQHKVKKYKKSKKRQLKNQYEQHQWGQKTEGMRRNKKYVWNEKSVVKKDFLLKKQQSEIYLRRTGMCTPCASLF